MAKRPVIPDVIRPGLITILCGSAVGRASAKLGLPYAGPGNKLWPTLRRLGLVPPSFRPSDYQELWRHGLGLTDLNKHEFGADTDLSAEADDPAALIRKIRRAKPRLLAFTAKRPALVVFEHLFERRRTDYGLQEERIGATQLFVLPSPSGRAGAFWDVRPWEELAALHRAVLQP